MKNRLLFEWYKAVKESTNCLNCGSDDRIDFHHVDPKSKRSTVFNLVVNDKPKHIIELEMRKCVPLCKECHIGVHDGVIQGWLKDRFNTDAKARQYMPFIPFRTKRRIQVEWVSSSSI